MLPIRGIYEVAIKVKNLATSEHFYCDVLGLTVGLRDQRRNWIFLRAGGQSGMLVLQEDHGEWPKQHFAFSVDDLELERAAGLLKERGVATIGPVFQDWMPGKSVYFADPDGNELEFFACSSRAA